MENVSITKKVNLLSLSINLRNMKIEKLEQDTEFTMYMIYYKGYQDSIINYFNPRIRNKVNELLEFYLYKRFLEVN
jgi:hypothetical protein